MLGVTLLLHTSVQSLHLGQGQGAMLGHAHGLLCCRDELLCCWPQWWWWVAWLWFQGELRSNPCVLAGVGMGFEVAFRGGAVEEACAVLGAALPGS